VRTLARAVKREQSTGLVLPTVYPNLEAATIRLRTGVVSMVVGEPGSYKSTFALNYLMGLVEHRITGLYVSAEDDETIVATRVAALTTGDPTEVVAASIREGGYDSVLKEMSQYVAFEFRTLSIEQIAERLQAFRTAHGAFPGVLYIDNLMSMVDDPTDYHGQMVFLRDLSQIAQTAPDPIAIMVLHHTHEHPPEKEKKKDGPVVRSPKPPPRWAVHGKVNQFPKLVLSVDTIDIPGNTWKHMGVAPVKNNYGFQDKTGQAFEDFWVVPESARIRPMNESA